MLIPFSSDNDLTIKFGAFPIYVLAPMNTAPQEIAISILTGTTPSVVATPVVKCMAPAVVRKTRYVGVLSRKLESAPVAQNISNGSVIPRPEPALFNTIRAGCMVMKIPMKSTATSWIAPHVKWFCTRTSFGVVLKESKAASRMIAISIIAVFLASNPNSSVFQIVSFAWAGFGAAFGPVVLCSLFWKRANKYGIVSGMIAGGAMIFIWKFGIAKLGGIFAVYELLPAFVFATLVIIVVSLATGKPSKEVMDKFEEVRNMSK